MKKFMALLLAVLMLITLFAGCTDTQEPDDSADDQQQEEQSNDQEESKDNEEEEGDDAEDTAWTPEKNFQLIIPFSAGGASDVAARIVVKYMNQYSDTNIDIVNLPGSGGQVGMAEAANAEPDGYTFVSVPTGWFMSYALEMVDMAWSDYDPITIWADSYMAIAVNADSEYETYEDFINAAKENPNTVKFAAVNGTLPKLATLAIGQHEGVTFNYVDLEESSKSPELLGNRIDAYVDAFASLVSYAESGDFRILGVFADEELPGYEDIPTMKELGMETNLDYLSQRYSFWAPKGTPEGAIEYIANLVKQASEDPACQEEIAELYYSVSYMPTADYLAYLERVQNDTTDAVNALMK